MMKKANTITNKNFHKHAKWLILLSTTVLAILTATLGIAFWACSDILRNLDVVSAKTALIQLMPMILTALCIPFVIYIRSISRTLNKADIVGKALRDPLTGAFNRNYFDEFYLEQVRLFNRFGHVFSVAIIDIDYFKNINDLFGHDIGDMVLKELVQHLRKNIRATDILSRLGGEEFVILFPDTDLQTSKSLAEKIRQTIDEKHNFSSGHMTVSIGVASIEQLSDSVNDVMKLADQSLYEAKGNGRNRVCSR